MQEMVRSRFSTCCPPLAGLPLKDSGPAVLAPDSLRGISEPRDPVPTLCWQVSCRQVAFKIGPKAKPAQGAPFFVACQLWLFALLAWVFRFPGLLPAVFPVQSNFFPRSIGRLLTLTKLEMWRKMKTNRVNPGDCWHYKDIR